MNVSAAARLHWREGRSVDVSELPPEGLESLRVLVADDNQDSAATMAILLRIMKAVVCVAHDGQEAVALAETFHPEVAILDIGMPNMNGYEAARCIRAMPWGDTVLLIAATGWGQDSDRACTTEAGFDHHLVKPVELVRLFHLLRQRCAARAAVEV